MVLIPRIGAQSPFQLGVVGLDAVVRVPLDVMPHGGFHLIEDPGVGGRPVGDALARHDTGGGSRLLEDRRTASLSGRVEA